MAVRVGRVEDTFGSSCYPSGSASQRQVCWQAHSKRCSFTSRIHDGLLSSSKAGSVSCMAVARRMTSHRPAHNPRAQPITAHPQSRTQGIQAHQAGKAAGVTNLCQGRHILRCERPQLLHDLHCMQPGKHAIKPRPPLADRLQCLRAGALTESSHCTLSKSGY